MERSKFIAQLSQRVHEKRKFIQVVCGARQIGKTTIIDQFLETYESEYIYESADAINGNEQTWLEQIWDNARKRGVSTDEFLIVIDEIQKIPNWSEMVKKFYDQDTRSKTNIKVVLSGSSRLLIEKGLTESLHGRFELIQVPHWTFTEMQEAFGFSLDEYIFFGGYPGPAHLINDITRWKNYMLNSIIETSISKDILMLTTITKPALLRQLFNLGAVYSSQIMPFNKMLGTLTDAGNTVTLSNYLNLLDQSKLLGGLQKYSGSEQRSRSSSPKLQVYNNALFAVMRGKTFNEARSTPDLWGRFVESCVGTHLVNSTASGTYKVFYWRDGNDEVDFVITDGEKLCAIEVKSGNHLTNKGMQVFKELYPKCKLYTISADARPHSMLIPLQEFLCMKPEELL